MPDVQDGHLQYVMATLLFQRLQFTAPALSQDLGVLTLVLSVYWGAHTWDVKCKITNPHQDEEIFIQLESDGLMEKIARSVIIRAPGAPACELQLSEYDFARLTDEGKNLCSHGQGQPAKITDQFLSSVKNEAITQHEALNK